MRVALLSDIHGNVPALEAVLAELGDVDQIVCLGDVAVGPQPREALARIRELGCPVVVGNWDAAFVGAPVPAPADETAAIVNEIHAWWGAQLDDDDRAFIRTFVPRLELRLDGLDTLCFHGSPRSYDDWVFATTPEAELAKMFDGLRRPLLAGGHTHLQLARRWDGDLLVNPGSVGLPFLEWWPRRVVIAPWAEYAIVTAEGGKLHVDLRRTRFDVDGLLALSRASGMPHADWWADCWAATG